MRVKEADVKNKDQDFWETMHLPELPPGLEGYSVYTNAAHQNEVMLVFNWGSDNPAPGGSELARSMAERLRAHGMVSRSAWQGKLILDSPVP